MALADLPTEISQMAQFFPLRLPTLDASHLSTWILENCLPPFPVAWSLFESYWEHYSWQCVLELLYLFDRLNIPQFYTHHPAWFRGANILAIVSWRSESL